ncbi:WD40/YVTN/BNR-like repeat-containing protein [Polyangium jinanense]|uniref:Exo-alpha-sialidase n=1 Tax=Polyangium jinanense TaxID=2829994 RepID=A0A9X3X6U6_9BACT|nr:hypothetical protein [Polyangium jinanense]MDC3956320.1 hypothetical protein [Polyangium jinanense]MDC3982456.1 hypothetical protein [Polyangium jinanense]
MAPTNRLSCISLLLSAVLATSACGEDETGETRHTLVAVTHGEGRFVAVGYDDIERADNLPLLMSSADGLSWTRHDASLPRQELHDIAFGNGVFVAVGGTAHPTATGASIPVALTSDDGVAWTRIDLPTTEPLRHVAFGGGLFVIIDHAGQTFVSTDGRNFTPAAAIPDGYSISGITFGAGQFALWGFHPGVYLSPDAQVFSEKPLVDVQEVHCLHFAAGQFQGIGITSEGPDEQPTVTSFVVTSETGDTWAAKVGSFPCHGLAESNDVLVAGSGDQLYRSVGGSDFAVTHTAAERHNRLDVTVGDGVFVAVGVDEIDTSTDGQTWTVTPIPR